MLLFLVVGMTAVTASVVVAVFLSMVFSAKPSKPFEDYKPHIEVKDPTRLTLEEALQNDVKEARRSLDELRCLISIAEEHNWRSYYGPDI